MSIIKITIGYLLCTVVFLFFSQGTMFWGAFNSCFSLLTICGLISYFLDNVKLSDKERFVLKMTIGITIARCVYTIIAAVYYDPHNKNTIQNIWNATDLLAWGIAFVVAIIFLKLLSLRD